MSTPWSYIKHTLDRLFSRYIRLKNSTHQGYCRCVTCGAIKHWKEMDCGHFVQRDSWATRWDEKNVGPQCTSCNTYKEGNKAVFAQYLIERWGPGIIEELNERAKGSRTPTLAECKELARTIRKAIKGIVPKEE